MNERGPHKLVYCLLPFELAGKLHDPLREHFAGQPVEVVVEMRRRERRNGKEGPPGGIERRIGERRATQVAVEPLPLPRRARRYAEELSFVEAREPSSLKREDRDTARLVARFQAGDPEAFAGLYRRYFERVYAYLKVAFRDPHEAEDMTQEVFMRVFEHLNEYERRSQPFRSWLFRIVRNMAVSQLRKAGRLEPTDPAVLNERLAAEQVQEADEALDWITDRDLAVLVERLPLPQRQALLLRFAFGLNSTEAAQVLAREPSDIRMLQHRALEYLRTRLGALRSLPTGDATEEQRRRDRGAQRPVKRADVMRARRYVLK